MVCKGFKIIEHETEQKTEHDTDHNVGFVFSESMLDEFIDKNI